MNQLQSEAVQHAILPARCRDFYYPGEENSTKSCYPTYQENRYTASFPTAASGGSSTILFNPDEGLSDCVITLQLPAEGAMGASYANGSLSLAQGWGYAMIESVGLN